MEQPVDYHDPVLLHESIDHLQIQPDGIYVDVTFGGGGHSREVLGKLGEKGRLIAFDKDADAHHNKINDDRLSLVRSDFEFIENKLEELNVEAVHGILGDLGISSHQIDVPQRGFSFRFDAPLDMRMDQSNPFSAVELLNEYSADEIKTLLRTYGEIRNSGGIAQAIVDFRKARTIRRTSDLADAVRSAVAAKNLNKILTLVYQAVRIEVNGELDSLKALLLASTRLVHPGGRLAIISYHSLEDRLVKNFMRTGNLAGEDLRDLYGRSLSPWKVIARKAIKPSEEEIERNPRARSARLRVAEKI